MASSCAGRKSREGRQPPAAPPPAPTSSVLAWPQDEGDNSYDAVEAKMKTVQMTLDESLVEAVDRAAESLGTTRSGFTRDALRASLAQIRAREQERRHRAGYER